MPARKPMHLSQLTDADLRSNQNLGVPLPFWQLASFGIIADGEIGFVLSATAKGVWVRPSGERQDNLNHYYGETWGRIGFVLHRSTIRQIATRDGVSPWRWSRVHQRWAARKTRSGVRPVIHGWSVSGQVLWWHGRQATRFRNTRARRDQGRHWPGRFVPLKRMTDGVAADAARCAGPESEPMKRSADSSSATDSVSVSLPVQSRRLAWAARPWAISRSSMPPITTTRHPSAKNRPTRFCQWRTGQRLAAAPAPRWTARIGAAPSRPNVGRSRLGSDPWLRKVGPAPTIDVTADRRNRWRGGQASTSRRATRARSIRVGWTRIGAGSFCPTPISSSKASRDATSCRPGTHLATSVSKNPPPPIAQPTRRGMPASARTRTVRMSPRTSIPRSYSWARSIRPSVQTAEASALCPGRRSNQFRSARWT